MAQYEVRLPIAGYIVVTVEALDENDAIEEAFENQDRPSNSVEWRAENTVVTDGLFGMEIGKPTAKLLEN